MPWNYNDAEINGIIDGNLKDAPPAAPMSNTAASVRALLKSMWVAMRGQVTAAVNSIDAVNASLVSRSLNLSATIYVDGVNGDDARTGETNNANAVTGTVKTLARVAALHSGKTQELTVVIVGALAHNANVSLKVPILYITVTAALTFTKRVDVSFNSIIVGDGTFCLNCESQEVNIVNSGGIIVEAHNGSTGLGDQSRYQYAQGAIRLIGPTSLTDGQRMQLLNVAGAGTINVGNNTIFSAPGSTGSNTYAWNSLARYRRSMVVGGAAVLGSNATETLMQGDRDIARTYTPTSSTDANVSNGEIVADATYLYRKSGGTIKKIAWTAF
jgi:hypothetical protein